MSEIELQEQAMKRFQALSSPTRMKILQLCIDKRCFISEIAQVLEQTEANISAQVKALEKAGLIEVEFESGTHGIKKFIRSNQVAKFLLEAGLYES